MIESVEIKLSDFLEWRCGCPKPCVVENLLAPPLMWHPTARSYFPKTYLQPRCPSLYPFNHHSYKNWFPLFTVKDREHWTRRMNFEGEPGMSSFIRRHIELYRDRKKLNQMQPPKKRIHCEECERLVESGDDWIGRGVAWAGQKCLGNLCKSHCPNASCRGHGESIRQCYLQGLTWIKFEDARKELVEVN